VRWPLAWWHPWGTLPCCGSEFFDITLLLGLFVLLLIIAGGGFPDQQNFPLTLGTLTPYFWGYFAGWAPDFNVISGPVVIFLLERYLVFFILLLLLCFTTFLLAKVPLKRCGVYWYHLERFQFW